MTDEQAADRGLDQALLREVHKDLDTLEAHLGRLTAPGRSESIDLVLRLRRSIIEEFPIVE